METRHRIFLAINLAEKIKRRLENYQKEIESSFNFLDCESPIRWTRINNLHITLVFVGDVFTQDLDGVLQAARKGAEDQTPFELKLNRICLAPPNKSPRMIWLAGERNQQLETIKNSLEKALLGSSSGPSSPHITLGKIRQWQWKRIDPEEMPQIDKEIPLNILVDSIDIMESESKKGGPQYTILESIKL